MIYCATDSKPFVKYTFSRNSFPRISSVSFHSKFSDGVFEIELLYKSNYTIQLQSYRLLTLTLYRLMKKKLHRCMRIQPKYLPGEMSKCKFKQKFIIFKAIFFLLRTKEKHFHGFLCSIHNHFYLYLFLSCFNVSKVSLEQ